MEFIHSGFVLYRPYMSQEMEKNNILQKHKVWKRTLKDVLMFSELFLQSSKAHVVLWQMDIIYEMVVVDVIFHNNDNWIWDIRSFRAFVSTSKSWVIEVKVNIWFIHVRHSRDWKLINPLQFKIKPCGTLVSNERLQLIYLIEIIKYFIEIKGLGIKTIIDPTFFIFLFTYIRSIVHNCKNTQVWVSCQNWAICYKFNNYC